MRQEDGVVSILLISLKKEIEKGDLSLVRTGGERNRRRKTKRKMRQ